jgi:O-antigen/teichoic acid export membrane protein
MWGLSQWALLAVIARLGSPEWVGQYSFGLSLATPVFVFSGLNLRAVQATDQQGRFHFSQYLKLRLLCTLCGLMVLIGLVKLTVARRELAVVVILLGVAKAIETISDVLYGQWQRFERLDQVARAMAGRGLLVLATIIAALAATKSLPFALAFAVAASGLWLGAYEVRRTRMFRPESLPGPRSDALALLTLGLPLGLVVLLVSVTANIPRYVMQAFFGERALGFFSAASYMLVAGPLMLNSFGQALAPRLAALRRTDPGGLLRLVGRSLAGAAVLAILTLVAAALLGSWALSVAYGRPYANQRDILVVLALATGISYLTSVFGYVLTAAWRFSSQVPMAAAAAAATLVGCVVGGKVLGPGGVAWGVCFGNTVGALAGGLLLWRVLQRPTGGTA